MAAYMLLGITRVSVVTCCAYTPLPNASPHQKPPPLENRGLAFGGGLHLGEEQKNGWTKQVLASY